MDKSMWQVIDAGGRGNSGKFSKYVDRLVIIVRVDKARKTNGQINYGARILLSPVCYQVIGKPEKVVFMRRGSNVAITASSDDNGLKISTADNSRFPYISATTINRILRLSTGVYECHVEENGMIVFDAAQLPALI